MLVYGVLCWYMGYYVGVWGIMLVYGVLCCYMGNMLVYGVICWPSSDLPAGFLYPEDSGS